MDDEDAPQTASITSIHEIPYSVFGFLLGKAVEIDVILHRHFTTLQPFHEFSAESLDGPLDVFVAESDVHLHGALHKTLEVGHRRFLIVRRGVGGPDAAGPGPRSFLLFAREPRNAVHGLEESLQFLVPLFSIDRLRRRFFRLGFEAPELILEPFESRVKKVFFFFLHDETILSLDLAFVYLL